MSHTWLDAYDTDDFLRRTSSLVPMVAVRRGRSVRELAQDRRDLAGVAIQTDAASETLTSFLVRTGTDGLVVLCGDRLVYDWFAPGESLRSAHLLMSLSKSLAGTVAGHLVESGVVGTQDVVAHRVPELAGSAYGESTIQDLLDMTVSADFSMDFTQPRAEVVELDRAAGWQAPGPRPTDIRSFLATIKPGPVRPDQFLYCSATTDVLAWALERAAGTRYTDLCTRVWSRIGARDDASFTMDSSGVPYASAGLCASIVSATVEN